MALTETGTSKPGPPRSPDSKAEVAIIGAGPHGLSAAVHLRRAGVDAQVFGRPMSFWKDMPGAKYLRSSFVASSMIEQSGPYSLTSYMKASGIEIRQPVPLPEFIDYGCWVQETAVPDVDERRAQTLSRTSGGFRLTLEDGAHFDARRVVVACGIASFEHIPDGFEHLPPERTSHTADHVELTRFAGQRVAIVGSGQSSFEAAVILREVGAAGIEVLARAPQVTWLRGHSVKKRLGRLGPVVYAPTDVGPLWYSRLVAVPELFRLLPRELQDRIAARSIRPACSQVTRSSLGELPITTGVEVRTAEVEGERLSLSLSDGTLREVDHLMFGTGYAVDVARYELLDAALLAELELVGGYPVLHRGLESSVAGLHFAGAPAAWSFGPIMRFVSGSWYGGRAIAAAASSSRSAGLPAGAPRL